MPKVGDKEFPYTPEGVQNAKSEASRTGAKLEGLPTQDAGERSKNYQLGGSVPGENNFGMSPEQVLKQQILQGSQKPAAYEDGGKVDDDNVMKLKKRKKHVGVRGEETAYERNKRKSAKKDSKSGGKPIGYNIALRRHKAGKTVYNKKLLALIKAEEAKKAKDAKTIAAIEALDKKKVKKEVKKEVKKKVKKEVKKVVKTKTPKELKKSYEESFTKNKKTVAPKKLKEKYEESFKTPKKDRPYLTPKEVTEKYSPESREGELDYWNKKE